MSHPLFFFPPPFSLFFVCLFFPPTMESYSLFLSLTVATEGWEGQERQAANFALEHPDGVPMPTSWSRHQRTEAMSEGLLAWLVRRRQDTNALKSHCSHWRTRGAAWPQGRWQSLVCVTRRLNTFLAHSLSLWLVIIGTSDLGVPGNGWRLLLVWTAAPHSPCGLWPGDLPVGARKA